SCCPSRQALPARAVRAGPRVPADGAAPAHVEFAGLDVVLAGLAAGDGVGHEGGRGCWYVSIFVAFVRLRRLRRWTARPPISALPSAFVAFVVFGIFRGFRRVFLSLFHEDGQLRVIWG